MVVIRLARFGKKNHPTFRVVVSNKQRVPLARYREQVGFYNPHTQPATIEFQSDRIQYWLGVGAQPSATVHNLLVEKGLLQSPKVVVTKPKKKPTTESASTEVKPEAEKAEK